MDTERRAEYFSGMDRPEIPRLAGRTATPPLDPEMRLRPVAGIQFKLDTGGALSEIETAVQTTAIDAHDDQLRSGRLVSCLDGATSIAEAARRANAGRDSAGAILQTLFELGVLEDVAERPVPAASYYLHVVARGKVWLHEATRGILEPEKLTGPLLFGKLIETFHYVESAASHVSAAIAHAPTQRLRLLLAEFLADEYWHGLSLRAGLKEAGLSDLILEEAEPLPTTAAVVNLLRVVAQTHFLGYAACGGVSESPTGFEGLANVEADAWRQLGARSLLPDAVLAPFRDHDVLDAAADHGSIFIEPFLERGMLEPRECREVEVTVRRLCLTWGEAYRGIARFYGTQPELLPFSRRTTLFRDT
jgi:hypothetical protein